MSGLGLQAVAGLLALVSSVALGVSVLVRGPRRRFQRLFALGMLAFAAEGFATLMLTMARDGSWRLFFWVRAVELTSILVPAAWAVFVLGALPRPTTRSAWRVGGASVVLVVTGLATLIWSMQHVAVLTDNGRFVALKLDTIGRVVGGVLLVFTVAVVAALEIWLRRLAAVDRWALKYMIIGLGGVFLVRFYLLTDFLLFSVVPETALSLSAATVFVANVAVAVSVRRMPLGRVELVLSRQLLFRSTVVGLLGLYLFAVGAGSWIIRHLALAHASFWGSLLLFVGGLGLAAVLLSDILRWRMQRFIARHFYRSKYDYREQWRAFTARLGALVTPEQRAVQLLEAIAGAVGATVGVVFLKSPVDERYRVAATVGSPGRIAGFDKDAAVVLALQAQGRAVVLDTVPELRGHPILDGFALAIPLMWRDVVSGVILLGPERTGAPYDAEDEEFLGTVSEQAAGTIAAAQMAEAVAQAREFEAFHRLTSFVIHDIKNSVSALSMLSRNAMDNFDDPEFQRDAVRTVSATVERMKRLLSRLAARGGVNTEFAEVDLADVVDESLASVRPGPTAILERDLRSVMVQGDAEALMKVVENLVTNALEAVDGDGTVTVRTTSDGAWGVVTVADTGRGIPEAMLGESLFAPFKSTKPGGWGIGLYQAKEIVERHRGTIVVESRERDGTTFSVRIPLSTTISEARVPTLPTAGTVVGVGGEA